MSTKFEDMEARYMFEELGYKLILSESNVIDYQNQKGKYIEFDLINKFFWTFEDIDIQLLQAINKQVEELQWNK